ncbi:hypothetical protein BHM03_00040699 [Ensete ventricosum]|nr:hypothetical protein BHM03_00040699 [Ensete ventricosum]
MSSEAAREPDAVEAVCSRGELMKRRGAQLRLCFGGERVACGHGGGDGQARNMGARGREVGAAAGHSGVGWQVFDQMAQRPIWVKAARDDCLPAFGNSCGRAHTQLFLMAASAHQDCSNSGSHDNTSFDTNPVGTKLDQGSVVLTELPRL